MKEICNLCKRETFIQNKTKQLCGDCIYKINHDGKSRFEVQREKSQKKQLSTKPKKTIFSYKRKNTGERDLFLEIWNERDHVCTNCDCGLGDEPKTFFFAHIKSKGADNKKRLDKNNIRILCFECHFAMDHQGNEAFIKRSLK